MYYAKKTQSSTRMIGIAVAVVINAGLAWALASGFGARVMTELTQTEVVIIEQVAPDEEPPPPPPPVDVELPPPPPQVVMPEFTFDAPPPPNAIQQVQVVQNPAPRPEVRPAPVAAPPAPAVRVNPSRRRNGTIPEYPAAALRAKETGVTGLSLCVDGNGRVTDVKLVSTSGSDRLDRAALDWARRERFNAGTIDGKSAAMCDYSLAYEWRLPN